MKPITLPKISSDDLMWLLGVYIGDGYMERNRIYFAVPPQDKAHARVISLLGELFQADYEVRGNTIRINSAQLVDWILSLGLGRKRA